MFDFYQDYEDSSYQLYLPEGAAVPDKASAGRNGASNSRFAIPVTINVSVSASRVTSCAKCIPIMLDGMSYE